MRSEAMVKTLMAICVFHCLIWLSTAHAEQVFQPTLLDGGVVDTYFVISNDERYVVYRKEENAAGNKALYSVSTSIESPVLLSGALLVSPVVLFGFQISDTSQTVVFLAQEHETDSVNLYSVPIDGSSAPIRINQFLVPGKNVSNFKISPDGTKVVFLLSTDGVQEVEIYSVPIDGGVEPNNFSGATIQNRSSHINLFYNFRFSPDSNFVVFGTITFYSASSDGVGVPTVLGSDRFPEGELNLKNRFTISPDSQRVVYATVQGLGFNRELYTVPIQGGTPVKLHTDLLGSERVFDFKLANGGDLVIFAAALSNDPNSYELYSVSIDGVGGETQISNDGMDSGSVYLELVDGFRVTDDGSKVIFAESVVSQSHDRFYLYDLLSDSLEELNIPPVNTTDSSLRFIFDDIQDQFKFLIGGNVIGEINEDEEAVYRFDLSNMSAPQKLSGTISENERILSAVQDPSSKALIYIIDKAFRKTQVFYVADGSTKSIEVNHQTVTDASGAVSEFGDFYYFADDGNQLIYLYGINENQFDGKQLYSARIGEIDNSMCFPVMTESQALLTVCL